MAESTDEDRREQETVHRIVNNKNNLETLLLKRRLTAYEKELLRIIRRVDEEKLDWVDFIRRVKHCESDSMPEFQLIHKALQENPPSPIDLLKLPNITTHTNLPSLGTHVVTTDKDEGDFRSTTFRRVSTAPGSNPNSREAIMSLDRVKTDAMRQDLRSGHMVTRKDTYVNRLLTGVADSEEEASRDVLTNLPDIQSKSKSSKHRRNLTVLGQGGDGSTRHTSLKKTASKLEQSAKDSRQHPSGQPDGIHSTSANRDRTHLNSSGIPEAIVQEARNTYVVREDNPNNKYATQECFPDKGKGRKRNKDEKVLPLTNRVEDFYKRLDSWLVNSTTKPKSILSPDDEFLNAENIGPPQISSTKDGVSLPPIRT